MSDKTVEVGYEKVIIDKLYGPLIFCNLRVWADPTDGEWVVERERWTTPDGINSEWEEMLRFDCQESLFGEEE